MSYNTATLLLGSSVFDQKKYLKESILLISNHLGYIEKIGKPTETAPINFSSSQNVLNQLILIQTEYAPIPLLNEIKKIEKKMGRKERIPLKNEIYSDREIDIDILFFNELRYCSNRLLLPHHQVKTRPFVEQLLNDLSEI